MTRRSWFFDRLEIAAFLFLTACQPSSSNTAREAELAPPRYHVSCPASEECHESVALLVGLSALREPTRCTAALIGPTTAVTAGHCVARELATGGVCHDVWLGFAETPTQKTEWLGCSKVSAVSSTGDTLMAPDYAVLQLRTATARPALPLGRRALSTGDVVRMVSVTPDRFYDDLHEVRTRRCVVDGGDPSSPWSPIAPHTVRVLSSCPIHEGNSGAPLLDRQGRMRGLVHAGGPPFFAFGLMTESGRIPDDVSVD
ncbi:MAG: serine protease [Myxococcales bacterium]|nr:serine protease [Myxococcales bacterium]MDH3483140.1 serine protease [Myxococcales bacterium]